MLLRYLKKIFYNSVAELRHYNKEANLVSQYISPDATIISDIWNSFYRANRMNLMFKEAEAKQLGVYQSYFDVWNALYYYYMVVAWGMYLM